MIQNAYYAHMNKRFLKLCLAFFRGQAFGGPGFGPRFDAPGPRYSPTLLFPFTSCFLYSILVS